MKAKLSSIWKLSDCLNKSSYADFKKKETNRKKSLPNCYREGDSRFQVVNSAFLNLSAGFEAGVWRSGIRLR